MWLLNSAGHKRPTVEPAGWRTRCVIHLCDTSPSLVRQQAGSYRSVCVIPIAIADRSVCVIPIAVADRSGAVIPIAVADRSGAVIPIAVAGRSGCVIPIPVQTSVRQQAGAYRRGMKTPHITTTLPSIALTRAASSTLADATASFASTGLRPRFTTASCSCR